MRRRLTLVANHRKTRSMQNGYYWASRDGGPMEIVEVWHNVACPCGSEDPLSINVYEYHGLVDEPRPPDTSQDGYYWVFPKGLEDPDFPELVRIEAGRVWWIGCEEPGSLSDCRVLSKVDNAPSAQECPRR